ncbi:MAG: PEP-CTERM sorting domain-containing protein [Pirellulales bacterium]|nr:PEP-CTERM sorting domain-containing protein [Pirellulales bacterium]
MKSSIVWGGLFLALIALGAVTPTVYGDLITTGLVGRYETVGTNPYTESEGRVSSWNDQAGTAEDATQSNGDKMPYLVTNATPTGQAALDFRATSTSSSVNQYVTTGAVTDLDHATNQTWFVVFKLDSMSWSQFLLSSQTSTGATRTGVNYSNTAGGLKSYYRNSSGGQVSSLQPDSSLNTDDWYMVSVVVEDNGEDAGTITSWLNGGNEVSTAFEAPDPSDLGTCDYLRMGRAASSSATNYYDGMLAAVLVYNTNLSTSDRQAVESYLRETYIVPEPGTLALLATGALGLLYGVWKRRTITR